MRRGQRMQAELPFAASGRSSYLGSVGPRAPANVGYQRGPLRRARLNCSGGTCGPRGRLSSAPAGRWGSGRSPAAR
eukprot:1303672-Alexandrium_andersonii.AAC.1